MQLVGITHGEGGCSSVAISPDNETISIGFWEGEIVFLEASNFSEKQRIKIEGSVVALSWCGGGPYVAALTRKGEIYVLHADTGKEISRFSAHKDAGRCLFWMRNRELFGDLTVVSGGNDGYFRVWEASKGDCQFDQSYKPDVTGIYPAPDGKSFLVNLSDGNAILWDFTDSENAMKVMKGAMVSFHQNNFPQVWSPDGKYIITASGRSNSGVKIWDAEQVKQIAEFETEKHSSTQAWSPDGKHFAYTDGNYVIVREFEAGEEIKRFFYEGPSYEGIKMDGFDLSQVWWQSSQLIGASHSCEMNPHFKMWDIFGDDADGTLYDYPKKLNEILPMPELGWTLLGDESGGVSICTEHEIKPVQNIEEEPTGHFMPIGYPVVIQTLMIAKERDWRWFSNEPRAQALLQEQNVNTSEMQMLSFAMEEPNLGIVSDGMMKGIYFLDRGCTQMSFLWVNEEAEPIELLNDMSYDIAISYASEDLGLAQDLKATFEEKGLKVFWIDVSENPNDPLWQKRYMNGVFASYYFMPIVTENYFSRDGSITEFVECSDAVMRHWDSEFLMPMVCMQIGSENLIKDAISSREIDHIRTAVKSIDLDSWADSLTGLFGFNPKGSEDSEEFERAANYFLSCVKNTKNKRLYDLGFISAFGDRPKFFSKTEFDDGGRCISLYIQKDDRVYFRFLLSDKGTAKYLGCEPKPDDQRAFEWNSDSQNDISTFLQLHPIK